MLEIVPVPAIKDKTGIIDHLTRLPSNEHLRWQHARKRISYQESTHAIISVTPLLYVYPALTRYLSILLLNILTLLASCTIDTTYHYEIKSHGKIGAAWFVIIGHRSN